jgi:hypothetical protein
MTQAAVATVHTQASFNVEAIVLPRATWETEETPDGRLAVRPQRGTWYGHVARGRAQHDVTVIPVIACPNCGGGLFIPHSKEAATALRKLTGMPVPVAHAIDHKGKVSPDIHCQHGRCGFHRTVYLDRWNKTKPLYAIAYVNMDRGEHGQIQIDYTNAVDEREARFHFGVRPRCRIIKAGLAIGFYVDERTGRMTAD